MDKIKYILLCILLAGQMISCAEFDEPTVVPGGEDGKVVMVGVKPFVECDGDEDPFQGPPATRALITVDEMTVFFGWIMQFGGTGDDAVLLTEPRYLGPLEIMDYVPLLGSSVPNRVVLVGNVKNTAEIKGIPGKTTYGEMKEAYTYIDGDISSTPDGFIMMSGTWTGVVTDQMFMDIPMKRSVAKIEFRITNGSTDLTVTHAQLFDVAGTVDLLDGLRTSRPGSYPAAHMPYISYEKIPVSIGPGANQTLLWYIPRNQKGTLGWTPSSGDKNPYAPDNATYVRVRTEDLGGDVRMYQFYLGANMTNDFNIEGNKRYVFNITFDKSGAPIADSRIEDYSLVDYSDKMANSYIINPSPDDAGATRRYRIYPHQVNLYWNNNGYEYSHTAAINGDTGRHPWWAEIIWMDTRDLVTPNGVSDGNIKLVLPSDPRGEEDYIEFIVPPTAKHGNFVVGLFRDHDGGTRGYKDKNEQYSWSWHFWVTDYDPDVKVTVVNSGNPATSRYVYKVGNGSVHRYSGSVWETGIYKNAVIMDRNLGASRVRQSDAGSYQGILMYQYGRKDPFPGNLPLYDINGSKVAYSTSANAEEGGVASSVDMKSSIAYPLTFYYTAASADWSNDIEISPYYKLWKDDLILGTTSELALSTAKSIFDPCPYGWQLPNNQLWMDFVPGSTIFNKDRGLDWTENSYNALRYWPGTGTPEGEIMYPQMAIYRRYNTGALYASSNYIYLWTAVPSSASNGYMLNSYNNWTYPENSYARSSSTARSNAKLVRCLKILDKQ